jgi:rhodanese-related sulfurtransferase
MGLSKMPGEAPGQETADRFFHLLTDLSREVEKSREPAQKLDALLLVVLGSLGASCGFLWTRESPSGREHWIDRGIPPSEAENWKTYLPGFIRDLQPPLPQAGGPSLFYVRKTEPHSRTRRVPQTDRISLMLHWGSGQQFQGFLGLGKLLRGGDYTPEDQELLLGLVYNFLWREGEALIGSAEESRRMDLDEAWEEIRQLRRQMEKLDSDQQRRIFHLKTLYDISSELAAQPDPAKMLEEFLLMVMGTFGFEQGLIQAFERASNRTWTSHRGFGPRGPEPLSPENLMRFARPEDLPGNIPSFKALLSSEIDRNVGFASPFLKGLFYYFSLPEGICGILGLGGQITSREINRAEQELLQTLISHLLASLSKVNYSEKVLRLNRDLEERNARLEDTLKELVRSRSRIEVLEKAKVQIRSVIRKELERTRRVSLADVLFILVLGSLLGLIYNLANPGGISVFSQSWIRDPIPRLAPAQAKAIYDAGTARFIDARPEHLFRQRHIRGSLNLPLTLFDFVYLMKLSQVPPDQNLVVYGRNISRRYDLEVALKLRSKGHTRITILNGDLVAWRRSGLSLEP